MRVRGSIACSTVARSSLSLPAARPPAACRIAAPRTSLATVALARSPPSASMGSSIARRPRCGARPVLKCASRRWKLFARGCSEAAAARACAPPPALGRADALWKLLPALPRDTTPEAWGARRAGDGNVSMQDA
eukprot:355524-Chlamydomonas_euryale.AAC.32